MLDDPSSFGTTAICSELSKILDRIGQTLAGDQSLAFSPEEESELITLFIALRGLSFDGLEALRPDLYRRWK